MILPKIKTLDEWHQQMNHKPFHCYGLVGRLDPLIGLALPCYDKSTCHELQLCVLPDKSSSSGAINVREELLLIAPNM